MLKHATIQMIHADLQAWKAAGSHGFPHFRPATITEVDSDTGGKGTKAVGLATATPINWQQLISTLLPILIQLIPILIQIFGGG